MLTATHFRSFERSAQVYEALVGTACPRFERKVTAEHGHVGTEGLRTPRCRGCRCVFLHMPRELSNRNTRCEFGTKMSQHHPHVTGTASPPGDNQKCRSPASKLSYRRARVPSHRFVAMVFSLRYTEPTKTSENPVARHCGSHEHHNHWHFTKPLTFPVTPCGCSCQDFSTSERTCAFSKRKRRDKNDRGKKS